MEAFEEREVAKRDDCIVGEIYSIVLVLEVEFGSIYIKKKVYKKAHPCNTQIFNGRDFVACRCWFKRSREIFGGSANL